MPSLNSSPDKHRGTGTDLRLSDLPDGDAIPLFRELLDRAGELRVRVTGRSMAPFLRGGEILTIAKTPPISLRRGDLILFTRASAPPKLHRIIKVKRRRDGTRLFMTGGDALADYDAPVRGSEILGKARVVEDASSGRAPLRLDSCGWRLRGVLAALGWAARIDARNALGRIGRLVRRCSARPVTTESSGDRARPGMGGPSPRSHA